MRTVITKGKDVERINMEGGDKVCYITPLMDYALPKNAG